MVSAHTPLPPGAESEVERAIVLERARIELENRVRGGFRAYLVSLESPDDDPAEIQESLEELGSLVRSLGDDAAGATVQKKDRVVPATFIGQGKAEELQSACQTLKVDYIAFDRELSPSQVRNLEKIIERPVLDRQGIILQIFRRNAKSREAKAQVEIAQLEYLAPRISNSWIAFERQRGGGGARTKGSGEMQIELDRRRIDDRIAALRKELIKIRRERDTQRKQRAEEWNVVLVGYTNAGKTTLMNSLTESQLSAKDALFETLDSSVRRLKVQGKPAILVTDTVGFIRKLPHGLVASFRSTLEETSRADLLIHVVDVSHPRFRDHIRVTDEVLQDVGAGEVQRLHVFNKVDALKGEPRLARILTRSYPGSLSISAGDDADVARVKQAVLDFFARDMEEREIRVTFADARKLNLIYGHTRVVDVHWDEEGGGVFRVRATRAAFKRYFDVPEEEGE